MSIDRLGYETVERIRRTHFHARPNPSENPSWANCHMDCGVLLEEIDRLKRVLWLRDADVEAGNRVLRAVCESSVNGRNVLEGIDRGVADLARYRLDIEVTT